MSDFTIPLELIPPGVGDPRSRAFVTALDALLSSFSTSTLVVQDAWTVPAQYLPAMTLEAGLSEFVSPGMREEHIRSLIAAAPDIHAMTGTIAGIRRALGAVGIEMQWSQWFQEEPPGPHDTHKVFLFSTGGLVEDGPFSPANQAAARRLIDAAKRWSQDVAISYGVRSRGRAYVGALTRSSIFATAHPLVFSAPSLRAASFVAAAGATFVTVTARRKAA